MRGALEALNHLRGTPVYCLRDFPIGRPFAHAQVTHRRAFTMVSAMSALCIFSYFSALAAALCIFSESKPALFR